MCRPSSFVQEDFRNWFASGVDGVICEEKTPEALAAGIASLLEDEDRRRAAGRAAREDFEARFGPERFARQWAEVFLRPPDGHDVMTPAGERASVIEASLASSGVPDVSRWVKLLAVWLIALLGLLTPNPLLTTVGIGVLPVLAALLWRPGEPPILLLVVLNQWTQVFVPVLRADLAGQRVGEDIRLPEMELAAWLGLLAVVVLALGMRIGRRSRGGPGRRSHRPLGPAGEGEQACRRVCRRARSGAGTARARVAWCHRCVSRFSSSAGFAGSPYSSSSGWQ